MVVQVLCGGLVPEDASEGLQFGTLAVPQGSRLPLPMLFNIYMKHLGEVVQ